VNQQQLILISCVLRELLNLEKHPNICLITSPRTRASIVPLSNLVNIFTRISSFIFLITGNEGDQVLENYPDIPGYSIRYKPRSFFIARMLDNLIMQTKISLKIVHVNRSIDEYVFFMAEGLLLPMLVCKILRKSVILILAGSIIKILERDNGIYSKLLVALEKTNYRVADRIVVYSQSLIREWELTKYQTKISIAGEHIIDFNVFKSLIPLDKRDLVVSYFGRLSQEKGVMNFVQSIPLILGSNYSISFLIGGDGPLHDDIQNILDKNQLNDKVKMLGWVNHRDLPKYFNQSSLVILPSFTEGLPNILLEAMACGTPVLATKVGAIPDIIRDGENGFIMNNNAPDNICRIVIEVLKNKELDTIAKNAHATVVGEYNLEKAVEKYHIILCQGQIA
jgi:glycosyltransferase involved in cell wall biosynthesis